MLNLITSQIWLYPVPIDFRKQIDGLALLVADALEKQPTSGDLFLFRNRKADKLKILYWEDNGFWLYYKRLERDHFILPAIDDEVLNITPQQLSWLLSGLGIYTQPLRKPLSIQHFY